MELHDLFDFLWPMQMGRMRWLLLQVRAVFRRPALGVDPMLLMLALEWLLVFRRKLRLPAFGHTAKFYGLAWTCTLLYHAPL